MLGWMGISRGRLTRATLLFMGLAVSFCLFSGIPAYADTFVRGYISSKSLERGTLVALDPSNANKVEIAPASDINRIYGVVVDKSEAPISLLYSGQNVLVATDGQYQVLVSAENGVINSGDYISVSSIDGVGAKAQRTQAVSIGIAQKSFNGVDGIVKKSEKGVSLGRIPVDIMIGDNPLYRDISAPSAIRKVGESIAGKPLSAIRIYIALVAFILVMIIIGVLMYGAVRSSIGAIGRNPLSKSSILKGLSSVLLVSGVIFGVGMLLIYLLLKL